MIHRWITHHLLKWMHLCLYLYVGMCENKVEILLTTYLLVEIVEVVETLLVSKAYITSLCYKYKIS